MQVLLLPCSPLPGIPPAADRTSAFIRILQPYIDTCDSAAGPAALDRSVAVRVCRALGLLAAVALTLRSEPAGARAVLYRTVQRVLSCLHVFVSALCTSGFGSPLPLPLPSLSPAAKRASSAVPFLLYAADAIKAARILLVTCSASAMAGSSATGEPSAGGGGGAAVISDLLSLLGRLPVASAASKWGTGSAALALVDQFVRLAADAASLCGSRPGSHSPPSGRGSAAAAADTLRLSHTLLGPCLDSLLPAVEVPSHPWHDEDCCAAVCLFGRELLRAHWGSLLVSAPHKSMLAEASASPAPDSSAEFASPAAAQTWRRLISLSLSAIAAAATAATAASPLAVPPPPPPSLLRAHLTTLAVLHAERGLLTCSPFTPHLPGLQAALLDIACGAGRSAVSEPALRLLWAAALAASASGVPRHDGAVAGNALGRGPPPSNDEAAIAAFASGPFAAWLDRRCAAAAHAADAIAAATAATASVSRASQSAAAFVEAVLDATAAMQLLG
jgi:hypothetical protein